MNPKSTRLLLCAAAAALLVVVGYGRASAEPSLNEIQVIEPAPIEDGYFGIILDDDPPEISFVKPVLPFNG